MRLKERGVTLIALVVTIVVLLILAGITISNLTGDNGIINNTGVAKKKNESAEDLETIDREATKCLEYDDELYGTKLKERLESIGATVDGNKIPMKVTLNGERYRIDTEKKVKRIRENQYFVEDIEDLATYAGYKVINYETKADENYEGLEWMVFYSGKIDDNDKSEKPHIYLILKDYLKSEYLPTVVKNGKKVTREVEVDGEIEKQEVKPMPIEDNDYLFSFTDRDVLSQYSGSTDIQDSRLIKLNKKYFDFLNSTNPVKTNTSDSMKKVAYLMDLETWDSFAGKHAEYVIGGPTIELILKAYNKYKNQGDLYQARANNVNGYDLSNNSGTSWGVYWYAQQLSNNGIYAITMDSRAQGYLLASTSITTNKILHVWGHAWGSGINYLYIDSCALRPIVCLDSDVSLEKVKDESGKDAFRIIEE